MSSACVCHIEGEWCFYCEVFSPLEDRYRELETEAEQLRDENERAWHVIEEMRTTWKPADHCDSCAHLEMELRQHKTVREHYLAENEQLNTDVKRLRDENRRLGGALANILGLIETGYLTRMKMSAAVDIAIRDAKEALKLANED